MSVNRSGYYKWLKRKNTYNRYEEKRILLTKLIKEMHSKHSTYGYHNIAQHIRDETDLTFSDNLIHKCCKEAKIRSQARKTYRYKKPGHESIKYPNLVKGKWDANKPMELVVSDMTVLKNKNGSRYEWTYILDTYNNEIIASSISRREGDPKPYYDCLNSLIKKTKEQTHPVILHTDQGSIYSSRAFEKAHIDYTKIIRSMSRVGTPTDNPIIESINGWVKEELYKDFDLYNSENVPALINDYVKYYNNYRFSVKCGWKSPVQFKIEQGFG